MDSPADAIAAGEPDPIRVPPRRRAIGAWLAWVVIWLAVGGIAGQRYLPAPEGVADQVEAQDVRLRMVLLELQGRYFIGVANLLGPAAGDLKNELHKLNRGSVDQRLRFMALAGELVGPADALQQLKELDDLCKENNVELSPTQKRIRSILGRLYRDYDQGDFQAPSVNEEERVFLLEELGWFGELALHPRERPDVEGRKNALRPTLFTVGAILGGFLVAGLATVVGFFGAILFFVLAFMGVVGWRIKTGTAHGGVYAETFALWLVGYFGISLLVGFLLPEMPRLMRAAAVMLASLIVLAWPMIRGVSWRQLRQDIGLRCEANPFVEIGAGIYCYVINLPLVAFGLVITIVLMLVQAKLQEAGGPAGFDNTPEPAHPIMQYLGDGDWWGRLQIFLLACVVAPLVEEIMFRGVLHRHLRELTRGWGAVMSALLSTTIVSFIFAAVHPQGLIVIPPLMFMAFGFSLMREWRGSLLPSMFAHGMSNGTVMTIAMIALSK